MARVGLGGREAQPASQPGPPCRPSDTGLAHAGSCPGGASPLVLDNELGDKIFGLVGHSFEGLLVKVPVGRENIV